jgi:hypothetical protein
MHKNISKDFSKFKKLEKRLVEMNIINPMEATFLRKRLWITLFGKSNETTINKLNYKDYLALIMSAIILPLYLLTFRLKKRKDLAIVSSRFSTKGKCKYLEQYDELDLDKSINLSFSLNPYDCLKRSIVPLNTYIWTIKLISILVFKFFFTGKKSSSIRKLIFVAKVETKLLLWFWKFVLNLTNCSRIYYVSSLFFSPLVEISRSKSIETYEAAHAFMHKFNIAYMFQESVYEPLLANNLILTDESNNPLYGEKYFKNILNQHKLKQYNDKLIPIKYLTNKIKNIIVIGQSEYYDNFLCEQALKIAKKSYPEANLFFKSHPLGHNLNFKNIDRFELIYNIDLNLLKENILIIGGFSNYLVELSSKNYKVLLADSYYYETFSNQGTFYLNEL